LYEKCWDIWLENPTKIKFSMGLLGGIPQTNEFKEFATASEFACYIGIVAFEYSSGKSVRGKTKVSQKATQKG
jgi:hypothetical protein